MLYWNTIETPFGPITSFVDSQGVVKAVWIGADPPTKGSRDANKTKEVDRQLSEYCAGSRKSFDLLLGPDGSDFQKQVWAELCTIPFGQTATYGQLAARLNRPDASRAIGRANATNPVAIIVPCHRVIGSDGELTGYAGGLDVKRKLLEHEGVLLPALF